MSELKELLMRAPRLWVASAESVTSGRVQARLGAIPGASHFFRGGITAYSLEQKVRHLGVERAAAEPVNCISEAVAVQMARGACALFDADIAVATTGYAEPSVEWNTPQPFAWWAIAHRKAAENCRGSGEVKPDEFTVITACIDCPGLERIAVQERVADAALAGLIKYLRQLRGS